MSPPLPLKQQEQTTALEAERKMVARLSHCAGLAGETYNQDMIGKTKQINPDDAISVCNAIRESAKAFNQAQSR